MTSILAYPCVAVLPERAWHFLWLSNDAEPDHVLMEPDGRIPAFFDEASARAFAGSRGIPTADEHPTVYDFARVLTWCDSPQGRAVDPELFLNAWNLLTDLQIGCSEAVNVFSFEQAKASDLYDKLFFANNLPAITPPGSQFSPEWDEAEVKRLSTILRRGVGEFTDRLRALKA